MYYSKAIDYGNTVYVMDYESLNEISKFEYEKNQIQSVLTEFHRLFLTNFSISYNALYFYKIALNHNTVEANTVVKQFIKEISNNHGKKVLIILEPLINQNTVIAYIVTDKDMDSHWQEITSQTEIFFKQKVVVSRDQEQEEHFFNEPCCILENCLNIILNIKKQHPSLSFPKIVKYFGLLKAIIYSSDQVNDFMKKRNLLNSNYHRVYYQSDKKVPSGITINVYSDSPITHRLYFENDKINVEDNSNMALLRQYPEKLDYY